MNGTLEWDIEERIESIDEFRNSDTGRSLQSIYTGNVLTNMPTASSVPSAFLPFSVIGNTA